MDGISVIGWVVDRRYLEGQPNPTDEFDLTLRPWRYHITSRIAL
jgi:hypothetical protein